MAEIPPLGRDSIDAQADAFRLAKNDGFDVQVLSSRSGISISTLKGWASGRSAMPAWAAGELVRHGFPPEHMSCILERYGLEIVSEESGCEHALFNLQQALLEFLTTKALARSDQSEARSELSHREIALLRKQAAKIATLARRAARGK